MDGIAALVAFKRIPALCDSVSAKLNWSRDTHREQAPGTLRTSHRLDEIRGSTHEFEGEVAGASSRSRLE